MNELERIKRVLDAIEDDWKNEDITTGQFVKRRTALRSVAMGEMSLKTLNTIYED